MNARKGKGKSLKARRPSYGSVDHSILSGGMIIKNNIVMHDPINVT